MRAEEFVFWLKGVRRCADGSWMAHCPAHEDRSPSLHVSEAPDGMIMLNCFAGCSFESVIGALGIEAGELFPDKPPRSAARGGRRPRLPVREILELLDQEALVVAFAALDLAEKGSIDEPSRERLIAAASRIGKARDYINAGR